MTATDPFTEAARAEAEARWPQRRASHYVQQIAFAAGAEWARTHLAAQEPTDAEVEAAAITILADEGGFDLSDEDDAYHIYEIQWKDMDEGEMSGRLASARAALSAARAVRRDEEKRDG